MVTRTLKRRLITQLSVDLPGFSTTSAKVTETCLCASSEVVEPSRVDPTSLTSYRHTALIAVASGTISTSDICESLCGKVSDFSGDGIAWLLENVSDVSVLRVLDMESHAAIQLVGRPEVGMAAVQRLTDQNIRRVQDVDRLPEEITALAD